MTETVEMLKIAWKQEGDGMLVTLRIGNDDLHLVENLAKAKINARFAVALVEIDESEQPVPPRPKAEKEKRKQDANVMRAAILCGEPRFQQFLAKRYGKAMAGALGEGQMQAADAMRKILNVESRKEIASSPEALAAYDKLTAEYELWKRGE